MSRRLALFAALVVMTLAASACSLQRVGGGQEVSAIVARSNNLFVGSDVRVLGMRVGRVSALAPDGVNVRVTMSLNPGIQLPADVFAEIQPSSLLGERFVALHPAYTSGEQWPEGVPIPLDRTGVPAETDEVLASFEKWLQGMDPDTLAELVDSVAGTLEGQGEGLNGLIESGGDTLRVLADSSEDLMAAVSALADLSQTMSVRDSRISRAIENWSTVVGVLADESDQVVEGMGNLRRLVRELKPLLDEHVVPLDKDLDVLTTALQTVDRNLARVGALANGSHLLFEASGDSFEHEHARLKLVNVGNELPRQIGDRMTDRLVGVCRRMAQADCAAPAYWQARLGGKLCWPGVSECAPDEKPVAEAMGDAMRALPEETQQQLTEEAAERRRQEQQQQQENEQIEVPLPDGRLDLNSRSSRPSFWARLARLLGGGR